MFKIGRLIHERNNTNSFILGHRFAKNANISIFFFKLWKRKEVCFPKSGAIYFPLSLEKNSGQKEVLKE